jgi:ketosteroid isomerase-like protein
MTLTVPRSRSRSTSRLHWVPAAAAWAVGTAATGKKFSFTGASMFSVKDGKIATQSDYYDALGFYKQLGLM